MQHMKRIDLSEVGTLECSNGLEGFLDSAPILQSVGRKRNQVDVSRVQVDLQSTQSVYCHQAFEQGLARSVDPGALIINNHLWCFDPKEGLILRAAAAHLGRDDVLKIRLYRLHRMSQAGVSQLWTVGEEAHLVEKLPPADEASSAANQSILGGQ